MSNTILTDAELEWMRADAESMMPDSGTIYALTRSSDGMGGWGETWSASGTAACRVDSNQGREGKIGASLRPSHGYTLTFPWDTTITTNNKVTVGDNSFLVVSMGSQKSWPVTRRVYAERI